MNICQYCENFFSSKSALVSHQKRTQYCLSKQLELSPQSENIILKIKCLYCDKYFLQNCKKRIHEVKCKYRDNYETNLKLKNEHIIQVLHLESQIKTLQEDNRRLTEENTRLKDENKKQELITEKVTTKHDKLVDKLVDKSGGVVVNNNHNNSKTINMGTLNLTQENFQHLANTFTIEHYNRGGEGTADWVIENMLTDENGRLIYRCVDKNRGHFTYKDQMGNIITDVNAERLKSVVIPLMRLKIQEYKSVKCMEMAESDDVKMVDINCNLYKQQKTLGRKFEKRLIQKTYQPLLN